MSTGDFGAISANGKLPVSIEEFPAQESPLELEEIAIYHSRNCWDVFPKSQNRFCCSGSIKRENGARIANPSGKARTSHLRKEFWIPY